MMPQVKETKLTDKNKMNDYNLDQRMSVTVKELRAELQESIIRLDMQIKELNRNLEIVEAKRTKRVTVIEALENMTGDL